MERNIEEIIDLKIHISTYPHTSILWYYVIRLYPLSITTGPSYEYSNYACELVLVPRTIWAGFMRCCCAANPGLGLVINSANILAQ